MPDLIALYGQLDDATLETMTSKGIMRRAGSDAANVRFESIEANEIIASLDGATVQLDDTCLSNARCTCSAATICRHKIAVVLALRARAPSYGTRLGNQADWAVRLAAFDLDVLRRAVGMAALREALRLIAVAETTDIDVTPSSLKVTLKWSDDVIDVVIPAHGNFAAVVSSLPQRRQPARHVAAILAARSKLGLPTLELPDTRIAADRTVFSVDAVLLATMCEALQQAFASGFAVPGRTLEERLLLLAISSRAEAMPRLSACLRRVAEGLELRRRRSVKHDPFTLLRDIAFGHALAYALSQTRDPERQRTLAGTVRTAYETIGDVDLIGLGATLFETATGAIGVTGHFVDATAGRQFTASLARSAAHDTHFDPVIAFGSEIVWGQTLANLSTSTFKLNRAQASDIGRLSLSQSSRAEAIALFRPTRDTLNAWAKDHEGGLPDLAHAAWPRLAAYLEGCFVPSLDAPPATARPVVVAPARLAPIIFDDLSQTLRWPLMDHAGYWTALSLGHVDRGLGAHRIAALEAIMGDTDDRRPFAIVALARIGHGDIVLEPMALWAEKEAPLLLDFSKNARSPQTGRDTKIMDDLRRTTAQATPAPDTAAHQTVRLLEAGIDALIALAEAGAQVSARDGLLSPIARRFEINALGGPAHLFNRILSSGQGNISFSALAAAHGLFTAQALSCRLPVWRQ